MINNCADLLIFICLPYDISIVHFGNLNSFILTFGICGKCTCHFFKWMIHSIIIYIRSLHNIEPL